MNHKTNYPTNGVNDLVRHIFQLGVDLNRINAEQLNQPKEETNEDEQRKTICPVPEQE